jgi:hypothetical protein
MKEMRIQTYIFLREVNNEGELSDPWPQYYGIVEHKLVEIRHQFSSI